MEPSGWLADCCTISLGHLPLEIDHHKNPHSNGRDHLDGQSTTPIAGKSAKIKESLRQKFVQTYLQQENRKFTSIGNNDSIVNNAFSPPPTMPR